MKKINSLIENNIGKILFIFLAIQPILDAITGICINTININLNISSVIRLLFLMFCLYYLIVLNKNSKRKNLIYISLYIIYLVCYFISVFIFKDVSVLLYEIKNILNIFYFPIVFLGVYNIIKEHDIKVKLKHIVYLFMIYILLIIIPNITNTSFDSYKGDKIGHIGWFLSANTIGSILSMLFPLILVYISNKKVNKIFKIIIVILSIYIFFSIGTKVPVLSMLVLMFLNFIYFIIKWIKEKKYKNILIIIGLFIVGIFLSILILPKTSFFKNLEIHRKFLKLDSYTEVFSGYKNINRFIFSNRLSFLKKTHKDYMKRNITQKLLGIGFTKDNSVSKTIEMDYFEIFYRSGILGFILYFIIFIPIVVKCFKKVFKFNFLSVQYLTILLLILLLAFFQGHILVTPSVSIYVALLISIILNNSLDID